MAVSSLQLADNIVVTTTAVYSQAVNMNGANAVQPTVVVTSAGGTTLSLALEGSNDLSNWSSITVGANWTAIGAGYASPQPATVTGIAFQYVRLKFTAAASGPLVCSAYLTTAQL